MSKNTDSNCNTCEYNNHGWCNKYKLQKPKAIVECNKEQEEADILEQIIEQSDNNIDNKHNIYFTIEEKEVIIHALNFTNNIYYNTNIDNLESRLNNDSTDSKDIKDIQIKLLDQILKEQEILNDLLEKFKRIVCCNE